MSYIHREFELTIWETSLNFGLEKGKCLTTSYTLQQLDKKQNRSKGDTNDAIMGRIVKRASTAQK